MDELIPVAPLVRNEPSPFVIGLLDAEGREPRDPAYTRQPPTASGGDGGPRSVTATFGPATEAWGRIPSWATFAHDAPQDTPLFWSALVVPIIVHAGASVRITVSLDQSGDGAPLYTPSRPARHLDAPAPRALPDPDA